MDIPDGSTFAGIATLVGAVTAGIVSIINAIAGAQRGRKIVRKVDIAAHKADHATKQNEEIIRNTNGNIQTIQAALEQERARSAELERSVNRLTTLVNAKPPREVRRTDRDRPLRVAVVDETGGGHE